MSKGNNRKGNKETKKPKAVKAKPALVTEVAGTRSTLVVAGKKVG